MKTFILYKSKFFNVNFSQRQIERSLVFINRLFIITFMQIVFMILIWIFDVLLLQQMLVVVLLHQTQIDSRRLALFSVSLVGMNLPYVKACLLL